MFGFTDLLNGQVQKSKVQRGNGLIDDEYYSSILLGHNKNPILFFIFFSTFLSYSVLHREVKHGRSVTRYYFTHVIKYSFFLPPKLKKLFSLFLRCFELANFNPILHTKYNRWL